MQNPRHNCRRYRFVTSNVIVKYEVIVNQSIIVLPRIVAISIARIRNLSTIFVGADSIRWILRLRCFFFLSFWMIYAQQPTPIFIETPYRNPCHGIETLRFLEMSQIVHKLSYQLVKYCFFCYEVPCWLRKTENHCLFGRTFFFLLQSAFLLSIERERQIIVRIVEYFFLVVK